MPKRQAAPSELVNMDHDHKYSEVFKRKGNYVRYRCPGCLRITEWHKEAPPVVCPSVKKMLKDQLLEHLREMHGGVAFASSWTKARLIEEHEAKHKHMAMFGPAPWGKNVIAQVPHTHQEL